MSEATMNNLGKRYVMLGNGKRVSLGAYVNGWRTVKRVDPATEYRYGLTTWWSCTAAEILRQYQEGMHDRINRHLPWWEKGRKW